MTGIETLMEIGEDTGCSATFEALKQLGVARYDHSAMAWTFTAVTVSHEVIARAVTVALGRSR